MAWLQFARGVCDSPAPGLSRVNREWSFPGTIDHHAGALRRVSSAARRKAPDDLRYRDGFLMGGAGEANLLSELDPRLLPVSN